jgi:hypothetical protein
MSFARHQTFHLRAGWLAKAVDALAQDSRIFSSKTASSQLGIGRNMVQSLRFWVGAAGLVKRGPRGRGLLLSDFAELVEMYDPYFELEFTWWLIHYHIASDENEATSWYYLFNLLPVMEFDRAFFVDELDKYCAKVIKKSIARRSLNRDYDCILATYLPSNGQGTPEDNIICPLSELHLLEEVGNDKVRKTLPPLELPPEVLFLALRNAPHGLRVNAPDVLDTPCSIGKLFNLSIDAIYRYLDNMQEKGWVSVSRTADLNSITISDIDPWALIEQRYEKEAHKVAGGKASEAK